MDAAGSRSIRTPDQRLRVFISSTIGELAAERAAVRDAVRSLRLAPVLFEMGARPHPPQSLYRAYLEQSDIFVGIYWESYGWVAPSETISGIEDEYRLSSGKPRLIYIKEPAPGRQPGLRDLLSRIRDEDSVSYQKFATPADLAELVANDLALMLAERFSPEPPVVVTGTAAPLKRSPLPLPRDRLIGREQEIEQILAAFSRPNAGVVTLTGPGGSGKTRLALETARRLNEKFPDGVVFVPLAPVTNPNFVIGAIAGELGIREIPSVPLAVALGRELAGKKMLLVLDNFEHVLDAAKMVAGLIQDFPDLAMLVTSRTPLRIRGEQEIPIPPLPVSENAGGSDAAALFIERAGEIRPGLDLSSDPAVQELVTKLDGLPLAIELAAARIRTMSPSAMLRRPGGTLNLLTRGPTDLPARQQALRDTIAWSYDLLDEDNQRLFRRLALFRGGFDLDAVEDVCGRAGVLDGVELLGESSLIFQHSDSGEPRYSMLETIREFAGEQLDGAGEYAQIAAKHADYYTRIVENAWHNFDGNDRMATAAKVFHEFANVRAALEWCLTAGGDIELGCRLLGRVGWYWYFTGQISEAEAWTARYLEQIGRRSVSERARGWVLWVSGLFASIGGDSKSAAITLTEAAGLVGPDGFEHEAAYMTCMASIAKFNYGDPACLEQLRASAEVFRMLGDRWGEAWNSGYLGLAEQAWGDPEIAGRQVEHSMVLAQETGDPWLQGIALNFAGFYRVFQGDFAASIPPLEQSVRLIEGSGDLDGIRWPLAALSWAHLYRGEQTAAEESLRRVAALAVDALRIDTTAMASTGLARLAFRRNLPERAAEYIVATRLLMEQPRFALSARPIQIMETELADIRSNLDDETFERAAKRMRSLDLKGLLQNLAGPMVTGERPEEQVAV